MLPQHRKQRNSKEKQKPNPKKSTKPKPKPKTRAQENAHRMGCCVRGDVRRREGAGQCPGQYMYMKTRDDSLLLLATSRSSTLPCCSNRGVLWLSVPGIRGSAFPFGSSPQIFLFGFALHPSHRAVLAITTKKGVLRFVIASFKLGGSRICDVGARSNRVSGSG